MSRLKIETTENRNVFVPGEEIKGIAVWQLDAKAEAIEVRLFWRTEGRGNLDVGVADTVRFDNPPMEGGQPFTLHAPNGPYSFFGKLVILVWGIELVLLPQKEAEQINITISPTGKAINTTGSE